MKEFIFGMNIIDSTKYYEKNNYEITFSENESYYINFVIN